MAGQIAAGEVPVVRPQPLADFRHRRARQQQPTLPVLEGILDAALNRPGFTGDFSVQNPCDPVKGVPACMEGVLHFPRRSVADGAV